MLLPLDYKNNTDNNLLCELHKSIYIDLSNIFEHDMTKVSDSLLLHNFVKSSTDSFIVIKHTKFTTTIVLVFVGDIIITEITRMSSKCQELFKRMF
jgi:hypothetical protein